MSNKLEIFKKRLVYRASYRGTKEMDILMSGFVKKKYKYIQSWTVKRIRIILKLWGWNHSKFL